MKSVRIDNIVLEFQSGLTCGEIIQQILDNRDLYPARPQTGTLIEEETGNEEEFFSGQKADDGFEHFSRLRFQPYTLEEAMTKLLNQTNQLRNQNNQLQNEAQNRVNQMYFLDHFKKSSYDLDGAISGIRRLFTGLDVFYEDYIQKYYNKGEQSGGLLAQEEFSNLFPAAVSSAPLSVGANTVNLATFRRKGNLDENFIFDVYVWNVDDDKLREFLKRKFSRTDGEIEKVVEEYAKHLVALRLPFIMKSMDDVAIYEIEHLTPVVLLLLQSLAHAMETRFGNPALCVRPTTGQNVKAKIKFSDREGMTYLGGSSDVGLYSQQQQSISEADCYDICGELKIPFKYLAKQGRAYKEKDQLLAELYVAAETKERTKKAPIMKGFLTDLFTLAISLRYCPSSSSSSSSAAPASSSVEEEHHPHQGGAKYYIDHRTWDPKSFILRLMVLFSNLDEADVENLVSDSQEEIGLFGEEEQGGQGRGEEKEVEENQHEENEGEDEGQAKRRRKSDDLNDEMMVAKAKEEKTSGRGKRWIIEEEVMDEDEYFRQAEELRRWWAACQATQEGTSYSYLGEKEVRRIGNRCEKGNILEKFFST